MNEYSFISKFANLRYFFFGIDIVHIGLLFGNDFIHVHKQMKNIHLPTWIELQVQLILWKLKLNICAIDSVEN